jgi:hypothetical protein
MIKALFALAALLLAAVMPPARAAERPIVVELFTSEGCSSCPPADALLAELATRPDVLALSFHVDYWDRQGWKDPFSSPQATARQRQYAWLLGLETVYTPQIVVDGTWEAVGSDRAAVAQALDQARPARAAVPITLVLDHGQARIEMGADAGAGSAAVLLIGFDRRRVDTVARGENAGRTLAHADVVRGFGLIGSYTGAAGTIKAPAPWQADRIAVLVQAKDGRILGAAIADRKLR